MVVIRGEEYLIDEKIPINSNAYGLLIKCKIRSQNEQTEIQLNENNANVKIKQIKY